MPAPASRGATILDRLLPDASSVGAYELRGAWSGRIDPCGPGMYLVAEGTLRVRGGGAPFCLETGDVLLLPTTPRHELSGLEAGPTVGMAELAADGREHGGWWQMGNACDTTVTRTHTVRLSTQPLPRLPGLTGWHPLPRSAQSSSVRGIVEALAAELQPGQLRLPVVSALTRALWLAVLGDAIAATNYDPAMLEVAERAELHLDDIRGVDDFAKLAGLSRSRFCERFAVCHGSPPGEWLRRVRMQRAAELLSAGLSVAVVAERLGYGSESAFRKAFKRVRA